MKNIAVLIYNITVEYHVTLTEGILDYFKDKNDVNVFIVPLNMPHTLTFDCDYQYWTSMEVLKTKSIDSVIVVVNSFLNTLSIAQLSNEVSSLLPKPIISISVSLGLPTNSYTATSSKKAYEEIIEHLITKHGKTKIAYFSASLTHTPESEERVKSYKAALKKNGLEYNKELVFSGDFTPASTHKYILEHYHKLEDIPYDALLCANDYMAEGAIAAFKIIGVRVPEDICVFGFDDCDIAATVIPSCSTINQHLCMSGYKAGELAYKAAYGKKIPKKAMVQSLPVYRQSCGCIPMDAPQGVYLNEKGVLFKSKEIYLNNLNLFGNALNDISTIYHMLNMSETEINLKNFFLSLKKTLSRIFVSFIAFCLYPEEIVLEIEDNFVMPENARLYMLMDLDEKIERNYSAEGGILFNPRDSILPMSFDDTRKRNYYLFPISRGKINYGYMICELPSNKYTVYEVYMKILVNAFVHAYEYSKIENQNLRLEETNTSLSFQSTTDELTKLYNRRGFMSYAQKSLNLSLETNTPGAIFFFDLDGLKDINDTWGHKAGDIAIQTAGDVLKEAFHKSDLVGHLSGDEFAVIANGFEKANEGKLRERIQYLCEQKRNERNLPFNISISMGVTEYTADNHDLQTLLTEADKEMYKEKNIKHAKKRAALQK